MDVIHRKTLRWGDDPGGPSGAITKVLIVEADKDWTTAFENAMLETRGCSDSR